MCEGENMRQREIIRIERERERERERQTERAWVVWQREPCIETDTAAKSERYGPDVANFICNANSYRWKARRLLDTSPRVREATEMKKQTIE